MGEFVWVGEFDKFTHQSQKRCTHSKVVQSDTHTRYATVFCYPSPVANHNVVFRNSVRWPSLLDKSCPLTCCALNSISMTLILTGVSMTLSLTGAERDFPQKLHTLRSGGAECTVRVGQLLLRNCIQAHDNCLEILPHLILNNTTYSKTFWEFVPIERWCG